MAPSVLSQVANKIVKASHAKSDAKSGQFLDTPIGKGGKVDDTSVVVAEIVEWTDKHREIWSQVRKNRQQWSNVLSCGGMQCGGATRSCTACESGDEDEGKRKTQNAQPGKRQGSDASDYSESEDESSGCAIA